MPVGNPGACGTFWATVHGIRATQFNLSLSV